jgi:hypothetical protein
VPASRRQGRAKKSPSAQRSALLFAPHDLPIGDKILDALDAAIRLWDKVVLILSEHSIKSDWVEDEVTAGFEEERKRAQIVLFPVRLDEAVMNTDEAWAAKVKDLRRRMMEEELAKPQ